LCLFQVNKIEIHYAKTAKKMDMKKLKQSMWSLLTEFSKKDPGAEVGNSAQYMAERLMPVVTNASMWSLSPK
jgi:hypothetical protein